MAPIRVILVASAAAVACAPAYADRLAEPARPQPVEIVEEQAPYSIEIIAQDGATLPTYQHGGKFYVLGSVGTRYVIRVTNPTANRIEAVVSVDGLDVIDGESADFVKKRGYVVPANGELRIEGFRVSTSAVAAFRFSSVADSYAGRKGKARNVGVIGLAVFEEKEQPQIIVQDQPRPRPDYRRKRHYDFEDDSIDGDLGGIGATGGASRGAAADEPAEASPAAPPRSAGKARSESTASRKSSADGSRCCNERRSNRPGLGTEFGERRHSAVSWTRFERRDPAKPDAFAELRYNDDTGLRALGIDIPGAVDRDELITRETADPFPASNFSSPPPHR